MTKGDSNVSKISFSETFWTQPIEGICRIIQDITANLTK